VVIHYFLKLDQNAPPEEREELIDGALRIDPDEPNALSTKASFLIKEGQWKKAYELKAKAINHFSDLQRTHAAFPDLLARSALLALIQGDDWEAYLEWAKDENRRAPWVIVAHRIVGMDKNKERVEKAKELLSGQAEIEGGFEEWLGEPVEAATEEGEQEETTQKARPEAAERYTVSSIEQMTCAMREELIVRLLVERTRRISQQGEGGSPHSHNRRSKPTDIVSKL